MRFFPTDVQWCDCLHRRLGGGCSTLQPYVTGRVQEESSLPVGGPKRAVKSATRNSTCGASPDSRTSPAASEASDDSGFSRKIKSRRRRHVRAIPAKGNGKGRGRYGRGGHPGVTASSGRFNGSAVRIPTSPPREFGLEAWPRVRTDWDGEFEFVR
jgi:hypothetical protein